MPMDIGFSVVESLKAIEQWINNINTNMVGAAKTGYKTTRISFGGSNTFVQALPAGGLLPTQQAEPSMRVVASMIDFTQGQVVASSQNTHFSLKDRSGIAGTNFFVLREPLSLAGSATETDATKYRYYLTRDGEFHWVPASRTNDPDVVSIPPNSGDTAQGYALVNNYNLLVVNRNTGAPVFSETGNFTLASTDPLTTDLILADLLPIAVNVTNPQNLVFSRYGSNIFDNDFKLINPFSVATPLTSFSSGLDVSQDVATTTNQRADRVQSALESSNSSVTSLIPELTLAQKMFTALSKILTVFNENLDITFGLIR